MYGCFTCFRELLLSLVCEPVPFFSLVCLYFALRRQVQDDVDKLTLLDVIETCLRVDYIVMMLFFFRRNLKSKQETRVT